MSPEQTIIVAKNCEDYRKNEALTSPAARYLSQYQSCKNCENWNVGTCDRVQVILNSID